MLSSGALASLQSTGAHSIESQEQVQHENEKEHAIQGPKLAYCTQREQQCDQRLLYVSGALALLQLFGYNIKIDCLQYLVLYCSLGGATEHGKELLL